MEDRQKEWDSGGQTMRVGQRKTDSESGTVDDRQGERDSGGQTVRVGQWMTDNEWDSGG